MWVLKARRGRHMSWAEARLAKAASESQGQAWSRVADLEFGSVALPTLLWKEHSRMATGSSDCNLSFPSIH